MQHTLNEMMNNRFRQDSVDLQQSSDFACLKANAFAWQAAFCLR